MDRASYLLDESKIIEESQKLRCENPSFLPLFLPLRQLIHGYKLSGFFPTASFAQLLHLGIEITRLYLILEFIEVETKKIKMFGEIHIAFRRPCLNCFQIMHNVELYPFTAPLILHANDDHSSVVFTPKFIVTNNFEDVLSLVMLLEHNILFSIPVICRHPYGCIRSKPSNF